MEPQISPAQYVSRIESGALRDSLEDLPGEPENGFFGPGSITWQVNRESAVFLAAGRAALLQIAHPWVAAALAQHSNLLHDAVGRFHSTFRVIYTMLFGSRAQALEASRRLYERHTGIRGRLADGEAYEANETAALRWVYATLVDGAMLAYEFVLPPLTPTQREQYYAESKRMAALFGIRAEALPRNWLDFAGYVEALLYSSQLQIDANALALGRSVLSGAGTWFRPPHWYRALTASWMPPPLRAGFELQWGEREKRAVSRAAYWLPRVYAHLPAWLRFVGPFHEAQQRLRGRPPGPLTRRSNRFWMGQPQLLYSNPERP